MYECMSNTNVLVVGEFFPDRREVHGLLNNPLVPGCGFEVDRVEKGPRVLMILQLSLQNSGGK